MSLTDSTHPAVSATGTQTDLPDPEPPSDTGVAAPDDRPWLAQREEITIRVSNATATRAWFKQWLEDADALFALSPNWNGYGERRVHASAIKRAMRILDAMDYDGIGPALSPRHDGSVQVEWHSGPRSVELVVHPNAPAEAWVFSGDDETTWLVETSADALRLVTAVRTLVGSG